MHAKDHINITIDKGLMKVIREMAEAESRNLSNMIEYLLRKAVADSK